MSGGVRSADGLAVPLESFLGAIPSRRPVAPSPVEVTYRRTYVGTTIWVKGLGLG
jgi:hypothetical protein